MANLSEDIQCVGFDTWPSMLDRTEFASWQQHIRLYCRGKENEGRFVTTVKLNRGLKESNYDQLYAYLKQHEAHANKNKMMLERFTQHMVDPLDLMSNVSPQQYSLQSSTTLPSTNVPPVTYQPYFTDKTQLDSKLSSTDNLIKNLTNTLALLTQSYKTYLPKLTINSDFHPLQGTKPQLKTIGLLFRMFRVDRTEADECDAFDIDVDEAPTAQTMFMENLSSADPVYDEAGLSYDSDILSEVHDHDNYQDAIYEHHEYVKDNAKPVIQNNVSFVPDAYMMIINEMHEQNTQCVSMKAQTKVVDASLIAELATYKEQVELYGRRAKFELTEREQKIAKQLRIVITDHNIKEENFKKELNFIKMQLNSTINYNKSMPALYNGHEIIKTHHVLAIVQNSEDTLEIAEITRKKMNEKMKTPLWTEQNINIQPSDYSKENYLAIFTPQTQLTHEQIFWSKDVLKIKAKALKEQTKALKPIMALMVYPSNTHATLVPKGKGALKEQNNVILPRNNKEVHLDYFKHHKESVKTLREIVEEARVEIPLDRSLASACLYTKQSQELLEYKPLTIYQCRNKQYKAGPASIPTLTKNQAINASMQSAVAYGRTDRPLVFELRLLKTYDGESLTAQEFCEKVHMNNGIELIKGSRGFNLYTILVEDMMKSSPICLLSKASKNKSWSWHRRLNHLNFGTINDLARKDVVRGLPRLKFEQDHLCSACQLGKRKKNSHKPKSENTVIEVLHTLHMYLYGPMRVQSINGKKYILVIVDDYSRITWIKFLRSKDETPEFVTKFLTQIQVGLNKIVRFIHTDNGIKFVNQVLTELYEKALMFLWAEAVNTACYTQNRSLIHTHHNKTPYELVHDKKPDITFLRVFGALCYPTNDSKDLKKLQPTTDIGIFVSYAPSRKGYRIYNKRTRRIMEAIHVQFDKLSDPMAFV
nr:Gag-Pol polyprotein [Tanacetum cinerariifolium]